MFSTLIRRVIFRKGFSLTQPTYLLPEEVNWLEKLFHNDPRFSNRYSYLKSLEALNRLPSYYENKNFNNLSDEEIFFFMNSKHSCSIGRKWQEDIVVQVNSTYFKCLLYREFALLGKVEQMVIILSFNEQVSQMKPYEIAFCLGVISDFELSKEIDVECLERTLKQYRSMKEYNHEMLLISGYLADIEIFIDNVLTPENLKQWIQGNNIWDLRAIYFIYKLHEVLGLKVEKSLKHKLDCHMSKSMEVTKIRQFEANFFVFLIKYYPDQAHKLNHLHFTPKAYFGYLQYFLNNTQSKIEAHPIPPSVIQLSNPFVFNDIFELRLALQLDTPLSIAKNITEYFTYDLIVIRTFVKHLWVNKIRSPEIQYHLQKVFVSKLHLQQFDPKICQEYNLDETIVTLTKFSHIRLGSVNFWRLAVKWVEQLLQHHRLKNPIIKPFIRNYLNLLDIAIAKNFKEETREYIYSQVASVLERKDQHVYLQQLKRLTFILSKGRIGEPKLWLLIQHRILDRITAEMMNFSENQHRLRDIASQFNSMNKGSPNLWIALNTVLSNNYKRDLLTKYKNPMSPIPLYISAPNEQ